MKIVAREKNSFQEILESKEAEIMGELRRPSGIAIETSPDQMDEIQFASDRDLAIRNIDRESTLLRQVRLAKMRIRDGSFGTCVDCDEEISQKRLAAVPWAARCIACQEAADRQGRETSNTLGDDLAEVA